MQQFFYRDENFRVSRIKVFMYRDKFSVPSHGTEQLSCESCILIPWVDNIYACVLTFEDVIRLIYRQ